MTVESDVRHEHDVQADFVSETTPALSPQAMALEQQFGTQALMFNDVLYNRVMNLAHMMAQGRVTTPKHLQNNPSDCAAIILQALRWNMDPFTVAQKTHLVNGTLGYEAQLVISLINLRAPIEGRLQYEPFGEWDTLMSYVKKDKNAQYAKKDEYRDPWPQELENQVGIRVYATLIGESVPREHIMYLSEVSVRSSSLWRTSPKQQLSYLAAKFWARLHCPDVIMGIYSNDELNPGNGSNGHNQRPAPRSQFANQPSPVREPVIIDAQEVSQQPMHNQPPMQEFEQASDTLDVQPYLDAIKNAKHLSELKALAQDIRNLNLPKDSQERLIMLQYHGSRKTALQLLSQVNTMQLQSIYNEIAAVNDGLLDGTLLPHDYDQLIAVLEEKKLDSESNQNQP